MAFRLSPTARAQDDTFAEPGFDDSAWDRLAVPGHWVLQGHGAPVYTNTRCPFPMDPPRVPTENPTGDHRVTFDVPRRWLADGETLVRFEGVESCARVWLNGQELGTFKGSRLPHEFAVGALLEPRHNVLAVRVPTDNDNGAPLAVRSALRRPVAAAGTAPDATPDRRSRRAGARADRPHPGRPGGHLPGPAHRLPLERHRGPAAPRGDGHPGRPVQLPVARLGVRLGVPADHGHAEWFGGGPGEAYPDTRAASRVGRWTMAVDALHTPYVRPQENGARTDVRWAQLCDQRGNGLRIEGEPTFSLTARRWTSEHLDAAEHTIDLVPSDSTIWLNLDHAQHGIGSQSCGPATLPQHRLEAAPATFAFAFSTVEAPSPRESLSAIAH